MKITPCSNWLAGRSFFSVCGYSFQLALVVLRSIFSESFLWILNIVRLLSSSCWQGIVLGYLPLLYLWHTLLKWNCMVWCGSRFSSMKSPRWMNLSLSKPAFARLWERQHAICSGRCLIVLVQLIRFWLGWGGKEVCTPVLFSVFRVLRQSLPLLFVCNGSYKSMPVMWFYDSLDFKSDSIASRHVLINEVWIACSPL